MLSSENRGSRRPLAFVLDDEVAVATMICKQLAMLGMEAWQATQHRADLQERVTRAKGREAVTELKGHAGPAQRQHPLRPKLGRSCRAILAGASASVKSDAKCPAA